MSTTTTRRAADDQEPQPARRSCAVVVGVDGSAQSEAALTWASDEVARRQATLHVVHAWMPPYPLGPTELFADLSPLENAGRRLLDEAVDEVTRRHSAPMVEGALLMDDAATALLDASIGADLLVIGAGRGSRLLGFTIGSVSRRCAERASCPVVVVPDVSARTHDGRIVAGVDGSPLSCRALRWATHEAALRNVPLDIVQVADPTTPLLASPTRRSTAPASSAPLEAMMTMCAADLPARPPSVVLRSLEGPAAETLVAAAQDADLLVIGARSRGRLRDRLLGSTAQRCIERTPCPIAVVHEDDDWTAA